MKRKRILTGLIIFMSLFCVACKGSSGKKTADLLKKYSGEVFNYFEKEKFVGDIGYEYLRHLEFEKVKCKNCRGEGELYFGMECEVCSGDGFVYILKAK